MVGSSLAGSSPIASCLGAAVLTGLTVPRPHIAGARSFVPRGGQSLQPTSYFSLCTSSQRTLADGSLFHNRRGDRGRSFRKHYFFNWSHLVGKHRKRRNWSI